ncbi:XRE family transcriptional regulator [Vibrio parahaemolyticus]|nr:XRE family transcriptional regulator [Vibrio parahaemolyticus]EIV1599691.1 XRE family transcriptional regulator [Vibrio parahaemolyticus]
MRNRIYSKNIQRLKSVMCDKIIQEFNKFQGLKRDFAKKVELTPSALSSILKKEIEIFTLDKLFKVLARLDYSLQIDKKTFEVKFRKGLPFNKKNILIALSYKIDSNRKINKISQFKLHEKTGIPKRNICEICVIHSKPERDVNISIDRMLYVLEQLKFTLEVDSKKNLTESEFLKFPNLETECKPV